MQRKWGVMVCGVKLADGEVVKEVVKVGRFKEMVVDGVKAGIVGGGVVICGVKMGEKVVGGV